MSVHNNYSDNLEIYVKGNGLPSLIYVGTTCHYPRTVTRKDVRGQDARYIGFQI